MPGYCVLFTNCCLFVDRRAGHRLAIPTATLSRDRPDFSVFGHFAFVALRLPGLRVGGSRLVDQFFKKRSVMNHGQSQILGAGLPTRLAKRGFVSSTVIVQD